MQHPLLAAGGCFMCWQTDFWCWFYIWFFWSVSCWHQKAQNTIPHWRRHSIRWAGQYFICRYLKENWKKGMVAFRRHCKAPLCLSVWAFAQPANTLSSDHFPVSDLYSRSCPRWEQDFGTGLLQFLLLQPYWTPCQSKCWWKSMSRKL